MAETVDMFPLMKDNNRILIILLGVLTIIAVGTVLKLAQAVVLPLVIAWLLSYILGPVIKFLTHRKVPTPLAVAIVLLLVVVVCYLLGVFFFARVQSFAAEYPKYEEKLSGLVQSTTAQFNLPSNPLAEVEWGKDVGKFLGGLAGSMLSFLTNLLMVIFFLIFLLLGKPFFAYKIQKAASPENAERIDNVLSSISRQISGYLGVQFLISLATGVCVWLALTILRVDFAVTWGTLAFFLNFIPSIGSIVASIPPILLAIVQFYPSFWMPTITAICILSIQMVIGNGIAPKLMGDKLNLSPVVVLLSLVFWGWLWGVTGMLLSIPIASAIKITCENIEILKPISVMMSSGRIYRKEFDAQQE